MTTRPFCKQCVECGGDVAITIDVAASRTWCIDVQVTDAMVDDAPCGHVLEMDGWLRSHEGRGWCADRVEYERVTGGIR